MTTVWVLGDQLNRRIGALADAAPGETTVLLIESATLIGAGRHRQRVHLVLTAMRRFGRELEDAGFSVDLRRAPSLAHGVAAHRREHAPEVIRATEPNSRAGRSLCEQLGVETVPSNQFLCHHADFATWAEGRPTLRQEHFYRWNRARLGLLMDGPDEPAEGRWNWDEENREPPPAEPDFPDPPMSQLDDTDRDVIAGLPGNLPGSDPDGVWATSRRAALSRLRHFVDEALPRFGPYEDAMLADDWHLAHSVLSPYLNLGLLMPDEVCAAVEDAYRDGRVPIQSAEGFIRQVIGWREYVWGLYWLWPDHIESNALNHRRHLPPVFTGEADTDMRCLSAAIDGLHERAWVHHIQRLMVLSSFANLYGIHPRRVMDWMSDMYIDAAEWVMVPNVMGMALWADSGRMATKPYVSGGAYIDRMSDYCAGCRFDPKKRVGEDACPVTTLYWDFVARHRDVLRGNARMGRAVANLDRLSDVADVRERAENVIEAIRDGRL